MVDACLRTLLESWNLSELIYSFERFELTLPRLVKLTEKDMSYLGLTTEQQLKLGSFVTYLKTSVAFKKIQLIQKLIKKRFAVHSTLFQEKDDAIFAGENLMGAKITQLDIQLDSESRRLTILYKMLDTYKNDLKRSVEKECTQVSKRMYAQPTISQQTVNSQTLTTVTITNPNAINNQNQTISQQMSAPEKGSVISIITNHENSDTPMPINGSVYVEMYKFVDYKYKFEVIKELSPAALFALKCQEVVTILGSLMMSLTYLVLDDYSTYRIIARISPYKYGPFTTRNHRKFYDLVSSKIKMNVGNAVIEIPKNYFEAPLDITEEYTRSSTETIYLRTKSDTVYVIVGIYFIRLFDVDEAYRIFMSTGKQRSLQCGQKKIMDAFKFSADICAQSLSVPLICPLSKKRIETPVVGTECSHVSCFDLKSFIACNINSFLWVCPICDKVIKPDCLVRDALLADVLSAKHNHTKVEFDLTGKIINSTEIQSTDFDIISID